MPGVQWSSPHHILTILESLTVYRKVVDQPPLAILRELLVELTASEPSIHFISRKYHELCACIGVNSWKHLIVSLIISADIELLQRTGKADKAKLKSLFERDLTIMQHLSEITAQDLKTLIRKAEGPDDLDPSLISILDIAHWPEWSNDLWPSQVDKENSRAMVWLKDLQEQLINCLRSSSSWANAVDSLLDYYSKVGIGIFSTHVAFRWVGEREELEGIDRPDQITIEQLVGQKREQSIVLENTLHFIHGFPANNVILYGDRGTGKSSLVKALLNEYAPQGLRLIELRKNDLEDFPQVVRLVKGLPQKFIIFIDDLSFDDTEPEYKSLKNLLEGGIEARPRNLLIYATSNRRHLIKETFSERQSNDVHSRDNQEEKLALADRFGITVTFAAPDQESYLKIVESLADQHQLSIDRDELRQRALRWLMLHNGRSGRTARQFIDHLIGQELFKRQTRAD